MMIVNMRPEFYSLIQDDIEIQGLCHLFHSILLCLAPKVPSAQVAGADSTGEGSVPGQAAVQCATQHRPTLGPVGFGAGPGNKTILK